MRKKYYVNCTGIFGDESTERHFAGLLYINHSLTNFGEIESAEKVIAEVESAEHRTEVRDVRILGFSAIPHKNSRRTLPTFVLHQRQ